ncbi:hypothetical protein [Proteiniphilum acetatigenes]|uniref:hypothetical protein n=1 Tax=Proteiniphilum acetatigenes TaxID=294710 RepID=UPI000360B3E1|nr:hypothetical protein [Proteiniphilum acetatigenes]SFK26192.1 hypothetical protein SAMN05216357_10157 [Porphyromonadaceae bacterium KH3CP3RA]
MKKVILFLSVIGATLLMTSCLGDTTSNYTDNSFVYLDTDERGQVYGKTFSRYSPTRIITSNSMMGMDARTVKFMVYSWDEDRGTTQITVGDQVVQADNVQLLDEPIDIASTSLRMTEFPGVDDPVGFDEILAPLYSDYKDFMNDYWVVEYSYKAKKGETANVEFYKRDELNDRGEIVIDIHLTLTGTPEGTSDERRGDAIALNMSQLRAMSEGSSGGEGLKIRFVYYKNNSGNDEPEQVEMQNAYQWKIGAQE